MSLKSLLNNEKPLLSFELFPPKSDAGVDELMGNVAELTELKPDFFTCTYGAGGSTRDRTLEITSRVRQETKLPVASHLTCVGSTRDELRDYLTRAQEKGVDYIVALRGDPPKGEETFKPVDGGLSHANELVTLIKSEFPSFGILVAGYPETHQEAPDAATDIANLIRKVESGADAIVSQLFYNNDDFLLFRDRCDAVGLEVPVIPGLLPVLSLSQVQRIAKLCKAALPKKFVDRLGEKDDADWQFKVGVEYATEQTRGLLEAGVPGIHYYVLNRATATRQILSQFSGLI